MTSVVVDKQEEPKQQPEVDFFADMVPEFKQPTQIRIRSNNDNSPPVIHSRLNADANLLMVRLGCCL